MAKICVPVCVRHSDEMRDAIAAAVRVADMVELRADCLVDPQATVAFLHERAHAIGRPLIVTMRSPEQGGRVREGGAKPVAHGPIYGARQTVPA